MKSKIRGHKGQVKIIFIILIGVVIVFMSIYFVRILFSGSKENLMKAEQYEFESGFQDFVNTKKSIRYNTFDYEAQLNFYDTICIFDTSRRDEALSELPYLIDSNSIYFKFLPIIEDSVNETNENVFLLNEDDFYFMHIEDIKLNSTIPGMYCIKRSVNRFVITGEGKGAYLELIDV